MSIMFSELEFQENKIRMLLFEMTGLYSEIRFEDGEEHDLAKERFIDSLKRVINLCLVYFEARNLLLYREMFEKEFSVLINDEKKLLDGEYNEWAGEFISNIVNLLWRYLTPFPRFENEKKAGAFFLENILNSTAVIVKNAEIIPKREEDVTKCVKPIIQAVFPNVEYPPPSSISKIGTHYIPDIHVSLLNCAIEFKYAGTEKALIKTIDQILIDVANYSNHPIYKFFYAVFYVNAGVVSNERFFAIWNEKEFPPNWKAILVHGKKG